MKYKTIGLLMAVFFVVAATAGISSAFPDTEKPVVEGSITYDPVTVHADVVDLGDLDDITVYFRYREKGRVGWTETEKRKMSSEGTYSKILTDIDPDINYEFQVVVEWIGDEDLIFETEKKPAEFQLSNLRAVPEEAYVDEYTSLEVDVENIGGQTGDITVDFFINERTKISEKVEVGAGDSKTVTASYVPSKGGVYNVRADGMTTDFRAYDLPSVEAKHVTGVTHDSAVLVAELTNMGLEDSVDVFFRYRTEEDGWVETPKQTMLSEGKFSYKVDDLDMDSDYRFRAVVEWDDRHRVGEAQFIETRDIDIKPNAVADEVLRGVNDIGVFFWGEGVSLDSNIAEYRWDFDGDGEWDYVSDETGITSHVFKEPGIYEAVFEIDDDKGRTDSKSVDVIIEERKQPLYKIEETADGHTRDVYFDTDYRYDEEMDKTRVAINVKNSARRSRDVSVTIDVPKEVVDSIENMNIYPRPTEVVKTNPEFMWEFELDVGETGRVEMEFDGFVEAGRFDEMEMVQAYGEEDKRTRTVTGLILQGVRRIWGFIVIVIVVIIVILLAVSDRNRHIVKNVFSKFSQTFLENGESDESSMETSRKDELDREFVETARRVKEALRRDKVISPNSVVDRLEKANMALENGDFECFRHYLGEVENQINYSFTNNSMVS